MIFDENRIFYCCVDYAVKNNSNINESPANRPLLSEANEETQADNREDQNTAHDTSLSSGVYIFYNLEEQLL